MRQLKISKSVTNRETASLEKYLQDIGKEELITPEEEVHLAQKIKTGDQASLEKLCRANLRFVVSVAKQYQNKGLELPDLINEGNLGLIKAAQCFDETRGFKFISYGVWWIRQSILQALAKQSRIVRLPLNKVSSINKISKAYAQLEQEFEREPTPKEIAFKLEISLDDVSQTLGIMGKSISIDAPMDEENQESNWLGMNEDLNAVQPDEGLILEGLRKDIEKCLAIVVFSERDVNIICLYFGLTGRSPMTLEEIGEKYDLTIERVRQIKEKAIKQLKKSSKVKNLLRQYLE